MSLHFGLEVQREEAAQQSKGLGDDVLRNAMVLDVEETTGVACVVDTSSYRFSILQDWTVELGQVDGRD